MGKQATARFPISTFHLLLFTFYCLITVFVATPVAVLAWMR
jgi:hypothetical protein